MHEFARLSSEMAAQAKELRKRLTEGARVADSCETEVQLYTKARVHGEQVREAAIALRTSVAKAQLSIVPALEALTAFSTRR